MIWPIVTSVRMTMAERGKRPCWLSLVILKCVKRAAISFPVTTLQFPSRSAPWRPQAVSASGSVLNHQILRLPFSASTALPHLIASSDAPD